MAWVKKPLLVVLALAALMGAFYVGQYTKEQEFVKAKNQQCRQYLLFAIDKAQNKDLADDMVMEALISNVYAAHEVCTDVGISAQLSDLWNTLMLRGEDVLGHEDALTQHLREILEGIG